MVKIGSPLFILREECGRDLMMVLEKLADIGFDGVEFLGLFGHDPLDIKRRLDSCGLFAVGDHVPFFEFVTNTDRVIADRQEIGCSFITISSPPEDGLPGGSNYPASIEAVRKIGEAVNEAGLTLLFHNHAHEVRNVLAGKTILEHIADDIDAGLLSLEPDLGWIGIGGGAPEYYLTKYKDRCPVVHFKDYIPTDSKEGFEFRPTGYGVLDNAGLYKMTLGYDKKPEWYIMDHDNAYERDIYDDLAMSLEYFRNLVLVTG